MLLNEHLHERGLISSALEGQLLGQDFIEGSFGRGNIFGGDGDACRVQLLEGFLPILRRRWLRLDGGDWHLVEGGDERRRGVLRKENVAGKHNWKG
jgi:hypothetical protein